MFKKPKIFVQKAKKHFTQSVFLFSIKFDIMNQRATMSYTEYKIEQVQKINPKKQKLMYWIARIFGILAIIAAFTKLFFERSEKAADYMNMQVPGPIAVFILLITFSLPLIYLAIKRSSFHNLRTMLIYENKIVLANDNKSVTLNKQNISRIIPYNSKRYRKVMITSDIMVGLNIHLRNENTVYNAIVDYNDYTHLEKSINELKNKNFPIEKNLDQIKTELKDTKNLNKTIRKAANIGGVFLLLLIIGLIIVMIYYFHFYK